MLGRSAKNMKIRGGVQIHTQDRCSFSSFGTWNISPSEIIAKAAFHTSHIPKAQIIEIRCKRKLTPEFKVVYKVDDGLINIVSLSVIRQSKKKIIQDTLRQNGYTLQKETDREPRGQASKDIETYGLLEDST